jgi:hypothetical protein
VNELETLVFACLQKITELNILSNIRTSKRYKAFMLAIAELKSVKDLERENFYRPLLDASNPDRCGQYAYIWQNSIYQGKRNEEGDGTDETLD